jgi:hypothetical protein
MQAVSWRSRFMMYRRRSSSWVFHDRDTRTQSRWLGASSAGRVVKIFATSASEMPSRLAARMSEIRRSMCRRYSRWLPGLRSAAMSPSAS